MEKLTPYTRGGMEIKIRRRWKINPRTRVKKSGKIYTRRKLKKTLKKELSFDISC